MAHVQGIAALPYMTGATMSLLLSLMLHLFDPQTMLCVSGKSGWILDTTAMMVSGANTEGALVRGQHMLWG